MDEKEDLREYTVVVNDEEQHSIWLVGQPIPEGWEEIGTRGRKEECLKVIEERWPDIRPLSLRKELGLA